MQRSYCLAGQLEGSGSGQLQGLEAMQRTRVPHMNRQAQGEKARWVGWGVDCNNAEGGFQMVATLKE